MLHTSHPATLGTLHIHTIRDVFPKQQLVPQSVFSTDKQYTDPPVIGAVSLQDAPVLQFQIKFSLYEPLSLGNLLLFPAFLRRARFTNIVECAEPDGVRERSARKQRQQRHHSVFNL